MTIKQVKIAAKIIDDIEAIERFDFSENYSSDVKIVNADNSLSSQLSLPVILERIKVGKLKELGVLGVIVEKKGE